MLAGLWVVSGFGGRLRTEPYQSRPLRGHAVVPGVAATNELFCRIEFVPMGEFATVGECVSAMNAVTGP